MDILARNGSLEQVDYFGLLGCYRLKLLPEDVGHRSRIQNHAFLCQGLGQSCNDAFARLSDEAP